MRTILALLIVLPLLTASLSGCSGCQDTVVNPESAEQAATLWSGLVCDRRGNLVKHQVNDIELRHDVAIVRAQLVAGDIDGKGSAVFWRDLYDFVQEHGEDVLACEAEVIDKVEQAEGRYLVAVELSFAYVVQNDGDFSVERDERRMEIEVTKIDEYWRITGEPANRPTDIEFHLVRHETEAPLGL